MTTNWFFFFFRFGEAKKHLRLPHQLTICHFFFLRSFVIVLWKIHIIKIHFMRPPLSHFNLCIIFQVFSLFFSFNVLSNVFQSATQLNIRQQSMQKCVLCSFKLNTRVHTAWQMYADDDGRTE